MDSPRRSAPRATRRVRLALASAVWTLVGAGLALAGARFVIDAGGHWAWFAVALVLGVAKGRFALAPRAVANARRIETSDEWSCVFGLFSWPMWVLVGFFMALGAALRHSPLPQLWLGVLYLAVGIALVAASAVSWRVWASRRPESPSA